MCVREREPQHTANQLQRCRFKMIPHKTMYTVLAHRLQWPGWQILAVIITGHYHLNEEAGGSQGLSSLQ